MSSASMNSPTGRSSYRTPERLSFVSALSDSTGRPSYRPVSTGARISMHTDATRNRIESVNHDIKSSVTRLSHYFTEVTHNIGDKLLGIQSTIKHKLGWQHFSNCRLCDKKSANVVEVPCGHVAVCGDCLTSVYKSPKCLVCATYSRSRAPVKVAECILCHTRGVEVAVSECGHAYTCRPCISARLYRGCPVCGAKITEITDIRWKDTPYLNKEQQTVDRKNTSLIAPGERTSDMLNDNEQVVQRPVRPSQAFCGLVFPCLST